MTNFINIFFISIIHLKWSQHSFALFFIECADEDKIVFSGIHFAMAMQSTYHPVRLLHSITSMIYLPKKNLSEESRGKFIGNI